MRRRRWVELDAGGLQILVLLKVGADVMLAVT